MYIIVERRNNYKRITNNSPNKIEFQLTTFQLKVIAMIVMLCDHTAKTIFFGFGTNLVLYIGRIAYPIFVFQLVEGYFKSHQYNIISES